jgi:transcriptional regulator with XRE-family HTH domain
MNEIGNTILKMRKTRGISQQDAAEALGITQSYLSLLECGKKTPSISLLERAEYYFKVPMAILMWSSLKENQVSLNKRESFRILKPVIDDMVESLFFELP